MVEKINNFEALKRWAEELGPEVDRYKKHKNTLRKNVLGVSSPSEGADEYDELYSSQRSS